MSLRALSLAMDLSEAKLGARLVMFALASYANDENESYPAVSTLAEQAKLSKRATQQALRKLEADGEIETIGPHSVYGTTVYRLLVIGGADIAPRAVSDTNGAIPAPELFTSPEDSRPTYNNGSGELRDAWQQWMGKYREITGRKTKGSNAAQTAFGARLRDGYGIEELILAIRGAHADDFMRKNGYDVPETILRPSKVDRYITLARENGVTSAETLRRIEQGVPQMSNDGGETWETDYETHARLSKEARA